MVVVRGHSNGKETAEGRKEEKEKGCEEGGELGGGRGRLGVERRNYLGTNYYVPRNPGARQEVCG